MHLAGFVHPAGIRERSEMWCCVVLHDVLGTGDMELEMSSTEVCLIVFFSKQQNTTVNKKGTIYEQPVVHHTQL